MNLAAEHSKIRSIWWLATLVACVAFGVAACGTAFALRMQVGAPAIHNPAKVPDTVSVSSQVMAARRISGPEIKYPEAAKKAKIHGTVILKALIGRDGNVLCVRPLSGPKELLKPSVDAVKKWKYEPVFLNGRPVRVETQVNVVFTLAK